MNQIKYAWKNAELCIHAIKDNSNRLINVSYDDEINKILNDIY